jgi:hypothetical protein
MGKTVPIRLNDEQLARVEESAALAGYKHLSTYMRDRLLEPSKVDSHQGGIDQWADQQRIMSLLESLDQAQATNRTILAIVVYLLRQNSTQGKLSELRAELSALGSNEEALAALLPEWLRTLNVYQERTSAQTRSR